MVEQLGLEPTISELRTRRSALFTNWRTSRGLDTTLADLARFTLEQRKMHIILVTDRGMDRVDVTRIPIYSSWP